MVESIEDATRYFDEQAGSIATYWSRFGVKPDWAGKRVLDLGCGHGAMSVQIAQAGGTVLGVDLDVDRIRFATEHVGRRFPNLTDRLSFMCVDATTLPADEQFDVVVTKDTFEHVEDLDGLLVGLARLLRPGGELYAGFSPLYHSPFGDHGRTGLRVPWAHTLLPRRVVLAWASRGRGGPVHALTDLGLNGLTGRQFLDAFEACPMRVKSLEINRGEKALLGVLTRARRIPALEKYATVSIYAVLTA